MGSGHETTSNVYTSSDLALACARAGPAISYRARVVSCPDPTPLREKRSFVLTQQYYDQAELDKSMKLLKLVENNISYVVVSSYLPYSASTPVKGASNIGLRARIARSINAKNVNCHVCSTHVLCTYVASAIRLTPPPPPHSLGPGASACVDKYTQYSGTHV